MSQEETATLARMAVRGYKSIEDATLELRRTNVLIGANGAGKSNLVSFFHMLGEMMEKRLQAFVGKAGGASALLFYGGKRMESVEAELEFPAATARAHYHFTLTHAGPERLVFEHESLRWEYGDGTGDQRDFGAGHEESKLPDHWEELAGLAYPYYILRRCRAFQFHDTSRTARVRQPIYRNDNLRLHHDAGNLAAVLWRLSEQRERNPWYDRILATIRQVLPWFGDFDVRPLELNPDNVMLNWREKHSDQLFGPHQLPDGALRAMALITLVLQPPRELPAILVIDEPELGLHPYAINVLAALVKGASHHRQIVLATQSVPLLDQFDPEDVVVVERENGASQFKRLDPENLTDWLEDYSLGELWQKNVFGGGPV